MIQVTFHEFGAIDDAALAYAVIMAQYQGQWLFVRHRDRRTWEIPGGRREAGERIEATASRELYEETGATAFQIKPVGIYGVCRDGVNSFGQLFYARVTALGPLPDLEIAEILADEVLPDSLTYPQIQPQLYQKVLESLI